MRDYNLRDERMRTGVTANRAACRAHISADPETSSNSNRVERYGFIWSETNGLGKTTNPYSAAQRTQQPGYNIITVEDPFDPGPDQPGSRKKESDSHLPSASLHLRRIGYHHDW